jgi:hypothetical protein
VIWYRYVQCGLVASESGNTPKRLATSQHNYFVGFLLQSPSGRILHLVLIVNTVVGRICWNQLPGPAPRAVSAAVSPAARASRSTTSWR